MNNTFKEHLNLFENRYSHVLVMLDGQTEEILDAIKIEHFDLASFSKQFDVPVETDPQMLDSYAVGPVDVDFLRRTLGEYLAFDFSRFAYFIEPVTEDELLH